MAVLVHRSLGVPFYIIPNLRHGHGLFPFDLSEKQTFGIFPCLNNILCGLSNSSFTPFLISVTKSKATLKWLKFMSFAI
jgi:hypothetical protein